MRKTCDDIINFATVEIREQKQKLLERQEKLKDDILERYPEDMYGIKWMAIYDEKRIDLAEKIVKTGLYLRAIEQIKEYVEEEFEHVWKKEKRSV